MTDDQSNKNVKQDKTMKVQDIAKQLNLSTDTVKVRLTQLGFKAKTDGDEVPDNITKVLLAVSEDVQSFAKPGTKQLKSASADATTTTTPATPQQGEAVESEGQEGGTLTLADVNLIAEVNSVSVDFVESMRVALFDREKDLEFQLGYYQQEARAAARNTGVAVSQLLSYSETSDRLDQIEAEINASKFNAQEYCLSHGIDLKALLEAQKKRDVDRMGKQQKSAEGGTSFLSKMQARVKASNLTT